MTLCCQCTASVKLHCPRRSELLNLLQSTKLPISQSSPSCSQSSPSLLFEWQASSRQLVMAKNCCGPACRRMTVPRVLVGLRAHAQRKPVSAQLHQAYSSTSGPDTSLTMREKLDQWIFVPQFMPSAVFMPMVLQVG